MSHSVQLTPGEFNRFRRFLYAETGISLSDAKTILVRDRLASRLAALELKSYGAYLERIEDGADAEETRRAIDLLTTNETYFFREKKHFDLLRERAVAAVAQKREFHVWSAACSSGEEVYGIAMVLADCFGIDRPGWSVRGSDISERVLARAKRGHYAMARNEQIPMDYLRRFCLKGVGRQAGTLLIDERLRRRVSFDRVNLNRPLPARPPLDAIFLRNVMIYFSNETKRDLLARLAPMLKADGTLFVGHSESLHGLTEHFVAVASATYRRAAP